MSVEISFCLGAPAKVKLTARADFAKIDSVHIHRAVAVEGIARVCVLNLESFMAEREVSAVGNCLVSGKYTSSAKCCEFCCFDDSRNYEAHITLGPVPTGVRSLAGMRLDYKLKYLYSSSKYS